MTINLKTLAHKIQSLESRMSPLADDGPGPDDCPEVLKFADGKGPEALADARKWKAQWQEFIGKTRSQVTLAEFIESQAEATANNLHRV